LTDASGLGYDPRRTEVPALKRFRPLLAELLLVVATFGLRAVNPDQPIVENYVGRQIPTAMVARNLERGSGFLRPELDTGPFPNLFLVEPPIFAACAVGLRRVTSWPLASCGRLISAFGMALATWGLYGLARRREGARVALVTGVALAFLPVTVRYGRAFQPDALMFGCLLAGLRMWDTADTQRGVLCRASSWLLLAAGFGLKIIAAYILVPLIVLSERPRRAKVLVALTAVVPALLWYVHAVLILPASGSDAAAESGRIWLGALVPTALAHRSTYFAIARFLGLRAFTPLGAALAACGLFVVARCSRLWQSWALAAGLALLFLAAKLHHEYYWLALAPPAAVGIGRALCRLADLGDRPRWAALMLGVAFGALCVLQSRSTWTEPPEWRTLVQAAEMVRTHVPHDRLVAAPEALLFAADRRGCRLELDRRSAERAAREWGAPLTSSDPVALIEIYRRRGARYVADVAPAAGDIPRRRLHDAIRRTYTVVLDSPDVLIAVLDAPEGPAYARR
jgi:hypothetical protein